MAEHKSLAKDLFEDMGRKVDEASAQQEEDDSRVVDEIESMCMNCHDNVRSPYNCGTHSELIFSGYHAPPSDKNPLFPRDCYHVLRVPALPLPKR